jgi:hypothetical protein
MTYQLMQNEKGRADLLIIVSNEFKMSEMKIIKNAIDFQTKGIIDIKIKMVDTLILSPRGKYKMYISNIGK